MNKTALRTKGTRDGKTKKTDLSCTVHKGKSQKQPANDQTGNEKTPTKLQ